MRQFIINGLMVVTCEVHDHGHAFIVETKYNLWMHTGSSTAELPKTPICSDKALGGTNYKKFICKLKLSNTYMEIKCATIALLKKVFHGSLVGVETTYNNYSPPSH